MALSGLDIYKLLPKTNCKQCGFATCLAFAMQLAKKAVGIDKCPFVSDEAKAVLESQSQPPIKLITFGANDHTIEIGNETVLFRHEEKFHHPCALGFIIDDNEADDVLEKKIRQIKSLRFSRVGQELTAGIIAVRQNSHAKRFTDVVRMVIDKSPPALVLMAKDAPGLTQAVEMCSSLKPLIYSTADIPVADVASISKKYNLPVVASAADLSELAKLTSAFSEQGVKELILHAGEKPVAQKIWDLTQIRRQALKKSNRSLGFPVLAVVGAQEPYEQAIEAASYICKYAGIILMKSSQPHVALSVLTLRQNIYTDPQKPLQVEPKLYEVGKVNQSSPVLVTTNFSLTYYTVLGEVEASKVPTYIASVDTEGMSVLTAWAAEKFTPERIAGFLTKTAAHELVSKKRLIIPGYVAVLSGDLEEYSGWEVVVGPKEASGIPSFLKNL